ncbi:MAG: carboxypeptidase regulatory-like domain-containing protein [Ignavibacteriae bacterium]|nr:carboxypeptidase regulatory-like domain-containing protein [Ignavibacteriota bacterium]MCB9215582.1 carboxypeptidase regulatory-like domain-containing protein [Ignavibacteria bacterium]
MKRQTFVLPALLSFLLVSCTDNSTGTEPGTVWGYVDLIDQDGVDIDDRSEATVTIVGTSFSMTTASDGIFRFEDVPPGIYELTIEKDGYGWLKKEFQFVGNGEFYLGAFRQSQIPTYTIDEFSFNIDPNDSRRLLFNGQISEPAPVGKRRSIYLFYSLDPTDSTVLTNRTLFGELQTDANSDRFSTYLTILKFDSWGIPPGTTIYFRAYPSGSTQSYFRDAVTRKDFFTSLPETGTELMSFVLP